MEEEHPEPTKPSSASRAWRWAVRIGLVLVALVGLAAVVPAPYVVVRPAQPIDARSLPAGKSPAGLDGELLVPVVDAHQAKWVEVAWYRLAGGAKLEPEQRARAGQAEHGGVDPRRAFRESAEIALLVGASAVDGTEVDSRGRGVRVQAVGRNATDSPLRSGDVVVAIRVGDDPFRRTETYADLEQHLRTAKPGAELAVRLADGRVLDLPPLQASPEEDGLLFPPHALGMAAVETERPRVSVDGFGWSDLPPYAGTSSGLGMALAAYERLSGRSLPLDGTVYVTGEVGSDGGVYGVGDVATKVRAARESGADLILVPGQNARTARANAGRVRVRVVPVVSFEEALAAVGEEPPTG